MTTIASFLSLITDVGKGIPLVLNKRQARLGKKIANTLYFHMKDMVDTLPEGLFQNNGLYHSLSNNDLMVVIYSTVHKRVSAPQHRVGEQSTQGAPMYELTLERP